MNNELHSGKRWSKSKLMDLQIAKALANGQSVAICKPNPIKGGPPIIEPVDPKKFFAERFDFKFGELTEEEFKRNSRQAVRLIPGEDPFRLWPYIIFVTAAISWFVWGVLCPG